MRAGRRLLAIADSGQLEANKKVVMEFYRPGITPDERYALIHKDYVQHNAAPDPGAPGSYYETFFWDTFRVRGGKLVEHWEGATLAPPAAPAR